MKETWWALRYNGRMAMIHKNRKELIGQIEDGQEVPGEVWDQLEAAGKVTLDIVPVKVTAPSGRAAGGHAAAAALTPEERTDRAKKAAAARWGP